jgi:hypothetical protein
MSRSTLLAALLTVGLPAYAQGAASHGVMLQPCGTVAHAAPAGIIERFLSTWWQNQSSVEEFFIDPQLLSNFKYIGLNKKPAKPLGYIELASPRANVFRYRLLTSSNNDLIVEVTQAKESARISAAIIAPKENPAIDLANSGGLHARQE